MALTRLVASAVIGALAAAEPIAHAVRSSVIRVLSTPRVTMRYFAEYLSRQLRMPVIDRTG